MSLDVQNPTFCDDGVDWQVDTGAGEENIITYSARDVQDGRTGPRTGVHAWIGIWLRGTLLNHDIFNVGRSAERRKLARDTMKLIGPDIEALYGVDQMIHDLDLIAIYLQKDYFAPRRRIAEVGRSRSSRWSSCNSPGSSVATSPR